MTSNNTRSSDIAVKGSWDQYPDGPYTFFFGNDSPFSQHHPAQFTVDEVTYNCTEQYMMHQKAVLFKDDEMAKRILETNNPKVQKKLGRQVEHFDPDVWSNNCKQIVKTANIGKFSQNEALLEQLKATTGTVLVEAAPRDCIWGIGVGAKNPKALTRSTWRGKNLLGYILTEVREDLCGF